MENNPAQSNLSLIDNNEAQTQKRRLLQNLRALDADCGTYRLESFKRNLLLIFNNEKFTNGEKRRKGSRKDVRSLQDTFSKLNFKVVVHSNRTKKEIFEILDNQKNFDFTDYGCLCVVVMSHGDPKGKISAKDAYYKDTEIIAKFQADDIPTLVTKPKIFIFQTCRGGGTSKAVKVNVPPGMKHRKSSNLNDNLHSRHRKTKSYTLPLEADMLVLHSTYPGKSSLRCKKEGTIFIQALCSAIDALANKEDLESIITNVKRDVAIKSPPNLKQIPVLTSTLIRKVELKVPEPNKSNE